MYGIKIKAAMGPMIVGLGCRPPGEKPGFNDLAEKVEGGERRRLWKSGAVKTHRLEWPPAGAESILF